MENISIYVSKKKPQHWKYKLAVVTLPILIFVALVFSLFQQEAKFDGDLQKVLPNLDIKYELYM